MTGIPREIAVAADYERKAQETLPGDVWAWLSGGAGGASGLIGWGTLAPPSTALTELRRHVLQGEDVPLADADEGSDARRRLTPHEPVEFA